MPYFEVWVDRVRKKEIFEILKARFDEVYEAFYDYDFIVRAENENELKEISGVKYVRSHYNC